MLGSYFTESGRQTESTGSGTKSLPSSAANTVFAKTSNTMTVEARDSTKAACATSSISSFSEYSRAATENVDADGGSADRRRAGSEVGCCLPYKNDRA